MRVRVDGYAICDRLDGEDETVEDAVVDLRPGETIRSDGPLAIERIAPADWTDDNQETTNEH